MILAADGLTGIWYCAILYFIQHSQPKEKQMARKNIIPKTVYIPEESEQMWLKVKEYIGMESDSAVIWNLIQTKFFEVKDGKGKRQIAQETLDLLTALKIDEDTATKAILMKLFEAEATAAYLKESLDEIKAALAEHGFDL